MTYVFGYTLSYHRKIKNYSISNILNISSKYITNSYDFDWQLNKHISHTIRTTLRHIVGVIDDAGVLHVKKTQ